LPWRVITISSFADWRGVYLINLLTGDATLL
jgi:hypothetical protein